MFGPFDDIFDFDDDGELDAMELGAEFAMLDELTKDELKDRIRDAVDEDDIRNALEEAGLDPDDYDLDDFDID